MAKNAPKVAASQPVALRFCSCNNAFQNKMYGEGLRVHNQTKQNGKGASKGWRCTVCGSEK